VKCCGTCAWWRDTICYRRAVLIVGGGMTSRFVWHTAADGCCAEWVEKE
jgi:hypothetical protein